MADVIQFPGGKGGPSGGDGSGTSMLENRVARLEDDMKEVKSTLHRIEQQLSGIGGELKHMPKATDYAALRAEVAEIKGRITNVPTTLQMLMMLITVWSVGTGIVFAVLRFAPK